MSDRPVKKEKCGVCGNITDCYTYNVRKGYDGVPVIIKCSICGNYKPFHICRTCRSDAKHVDYFEMLLAKSCDSCIRDQKINCILADEKNN